MRFPRFVPFLVCLTLNTFSLFAQYPNGNINGLVSDPSRAAVVGAEIVAVNDVTGVQYTTKTNSEGIYVLATLPPGPYRVQVSRVGFKTIIKPDIILNVQDALSINFTLPVGAFHEIVTVQGGSPIVNTQSAAVSTVIDQTYVENMPLNGRSFQDLILLTPGTVTTSPQNAQDGHYAGVGQTGEFSVNGQRTESNYFTVDGVSANVGATAGGYMTLAGGASGSVATATALGTTQALVSVDDLQEFRVQSSSYSAEYGRNPGGQFAFETKSGTNQWHGTGFNYFRSGLFDAQDWFNDYFGTTQQGLHQNDFGGTFGGPFYIPKGYNGKNKTFFFASYEGLRLTSPQAASINYVPDMALRAIAPAPLDQALKAFPVPNGPVFGDGWAEFIAGWSNPSSLDSSSVRFDHAVSDKLRLFFRFSDTNSSSSARLGGLSPTMNSNSTYSLRTYTAGASSSITTHLSNELRFNYSSNDVEQNTVLDAFGGGIPVNLAQLAGLAPGSNSVLEIFYDGRLAALLPGTNRGAQRQWNFVDYLSLAVGRHQLKFGVDYRRLSPFAHQFANADYIYSDEHSIEQNSGLTTGQTNSDAYPLYVNFSAFAQDEARVSQRLTLSLGLRWEVNPAPGVTQGLKPYAIQGSSPNTWALAPQGAPLWKTEWFNFAPRFGAAYTLRDATGRQTVIRGGIGIFFDTGQQQGSFGFYGPGLVAYGPYQPGSFPGAGESLIPALVNPPVSPYSTTPRVFPSHLQLPYTLQWNASIEQALGNSQALTLTYVGSHAARLLKETQLSTPGNPNSSTFVFIENGLTSDYDALQIQLRRRLSRGLTALGSYTWSHCIDYGSADYYLESERGNCDFDVRHNLSTALSYDVPQIGRRRFLRLLIDQWGFDNRITARTSFPVSLNGSQYFDSATGEQLLNSGLDLVPGQTTYLYGADCSSVLQGLGDLQQGQQCPGGRAINPSAFSQPPTDPNTGNPLRQGTAPRNLVRGFAAWQMDLALRHDFPIKEKLNLQFRAEAFNILNHPSFGSINPNFGSPTFGQATGTLASAPGVLNPLYQIGGPRSLQFALKLVF
ncbi:MAG TPA: carboxypeptidase regulatory-like domain-containing protein [Candidatus Sulfotelmatobacter sp.]|nr:carboxypeptidase regulatory-like domain-containing protein [Candidatus Sulfotelmatobacter sp.]